ncbi:helix-turn-helix domain-containing protein [Salinisphaera sp.]|uniref:helix-turn-helix domain-containing protein n=1 Tax=Salinisphaera sp. TaxID=1914330 RepID=UPI000C626388|nr:helix-turn-helix domain-containing protein [Salinisphaera sp.]MAS10318.1 hypothetical protein [Salinisphaera sp.]|tara:strand:+ start:1467 stop:1697 length:231 start_codon:yes stop_codon:yes gene_type:complete
MTNETKPAQLVTPEHAAKALSVSESTLKAARLHHLKSNPLRDLPYVRIGRSVRYRRSDIEAWIESNVIDPSSGAVA